MKIQTEISPVNRKKRSADEIPEEAADIVKRISEEEYQELVSNIRNISFLIREGFFTKKLSGLFSFSSNGRSHID